MENIIDSKKLFISDILKYITENPDRAAEILADLPKDVAHCVRYSLLVEFERDCKAKGINCSNLKTDQIPILIGKVLKCWCHNKPLHDCLTSIEEGWTVLGHETEPYIFDRARAVGMTKIDENGVERILTCGYSYT